MASLSVLLVILGALGVLLAIPGLRSGLGDTADNIRETLTGSVPPPRVDSAVRTDHDPDSGDGRDTSAGSSSEFDDDFWQDYGAAQS